MKLHLKRSEHPSSSQPAIKRLSSTLRHDPYIAWSIMLAMSIALALILASQGMLAYFATQDSLGSAAAPAAIPLHLPLNASALHDAIGRFDARAVERADLLKGKTGIGDPSL